MDFIVETSARHCHLSDKDLAILFGDGYQLTSKKALSQPGQFACEEKVTVVGEKGELTMSILGPTRSETQVELAATDARKIGIDAPIRESGELADAGKCKIKGPKGEIECEHAVIIAKRHIHMTPDDAKLFNVNNGQLVDVLLNSNERKTVYGDVSIRVSENYALAMHIDTDESNAAFGSTKGTIIQ